MLKTYSMQDLADITRKIDDLDDKAEINQLLDEMESLYEAVEEEFQESVEAIISRLSQRLRSLQ